LGDRVTLLREQSESTLLEFTFFISAPVFGDVLSVGTASIIIPNQSSGRINHQAKDGMLIFSAVTKSKESC